MIYDWTIGLIDKDPDIFCGYLIVDNDNFEITSNLYLASHYSSKSHAEQAVLTLNLDNDYYVYYHYILSEKRNVN